MSSDWLKIIVYWNCTFDVPSPKVFLVTNEWPLTSYLIHKIHENILCGIKFQPINYAWDKSIFKSKRNRKWFFFIDRPQYCPFDGIQIDSQCPIFHVEVAGGIGKVLVCTSFGQANSWRWEGRGPRLVVFMGPRSCPDFFLLHCSRIVLRPLPLVRTWMFVCFVCSLCLLPPPFPMLMSCQKSWRCNSCGKATQQGVKFVFSFFVVVLIKILSKWEAFPLGRCYVLRT